MFSFHVVDGPQAAAILAANRPAVIELVRQTYLAHHDGTTINPNSYFLRFPDRPNARIIALPAFLGPAGGAPPAPDGRRALAGLKWISSFPSNVEHNIARASAVLLLNDYETGYAFACLEASHISAARTAASAVLAAREFVGERKAHTVAVVGAGVIARTITEYLQGDGWSVGRYVVHDARPDYADRLVNHLEEQGVPARRVGSVAEAADGADLVVFATTAGEPHVLAPGTFAAGQTVLNISLRDLGPELIASAHNVLDDIDHCLNAGTSVDLAVNRYGRRDFLDGTLAQLIRGEITVGTGKPRIFSPFGLGVLDLAIGLHVYEQARARGSAREIPGFFGNTARW